MPEKHLTWSELYSWIDGDLDGETVARIESHLSACPTCGREAEFFKRLESTLAEGEEPMAVPYLAERVLARLPRERGMSWFRLGLAVPAAAVMAYLVNRLLPGFEKLLTSWNSVILEASGKFSSSIEGRVSAIPAVPTITFPTDPTFWLILAGVMGATTLAGFFLWFGYQTRAIG